MRKTTMVPGWAETIGWIALTVGSACALIILADELLHGHRQQMWIMNLLHPITALYWGPVWLWAYFTRGRNNSMKVLDRRAHELAARKRRYKTVAQRGTVGGKPQPLERRQRRVALRAGCTLGDIGGEWLVWELGPWTIGAAGTLWPEYFLDFVLAWSLGVAFQYFTIVPMRDDIGKVQGIRQAIRADTLSILSFQVGLFGWMALSHEVLWSQPLPITSAANWWMMQVGMIIGFFTAWPVNRWLIRKRWKETMDHRSHLAMQVEHLEHRPA